MEYSFLVRNIKNARQVLAIKAAILIKEPEAGLCQRKPAI
jgi:hypothetical protein